MCFIVLGVTAGSAEKYLPSAAKCTCIGMHSQLPMANVRSKSGHDMELRCRMREVGRSDEVEGISISLSLPEGDGPSKFRGPKRAIFVLPSSDEPYHRASVACD